MAIGNFENYIYPVQIFSVMNLSSLDCFIKNKNYTFVVIREDIKKTFSKNRLKLLYM